MTVLRLMEADGKLTDGGESIAGGKRTGSEADGDLVNDLTVDGHAGIAIKAKSEARFWVSLRHPG